MRGDAIVLRFTGDHVPSFKNGKMLARGKLITDPRKQKIMERITAAFASELCSVCQTGATATETEVSRRSWTASLLPLDDSLVWIEPHCDGWQRVSKGGEGVTVTIERFDHAPLGWP